MKKRIILCIILFSQILHAQINMELKIIDEKKTSYGSSYTLQIVLINESKYNYIIPIDTTGYKIYTLNDRCDNFYRYGDFPDLGIIPMIKNDNDNFMEGISGMPSFDMKDLDSIIINRKEKERIHKEEIKNWKKKYHIKGEYKNADINWYLYNQLKILVPGKKFTLIKNFSSMWWLSPTSFYYYWLKENIDYPMFLEICIEEKIYDYLTPKQKEEFKGYKFFSGKIQSNEIMIRK